MDERVYPAEPVWAEQVRAPADAALPRRRCMEELKAEAQGARPVEPLPARRGARRRASRNLDYAPLAEIMGRTKIASEACNCNAPDTGNMEVLHQFGTDGAEGALAASRCSRARSARRSR